MEKKKSILLFGEGKTEALFLSHLRNLYKIPTTVIKVEHGNGGSASTVVQAAIKVASLADYSAVIVLIDSDREDPIIPERMRRENRLFIKFSVPCIEGLFLEILEDKKFKILKKSESASHKCKAHFQEIYLKTDQNGKIAKRLKNCFSSKFPQALLDEAQLKVCLLKELVKAIQGL